MIKVPRNDTDSKTETYHLIIHRNKALATQACCLFTTATIITKNAIKTFIRMPKIYSKNRIRNQRTVPRNDIDSKIETYYLRTEFKTNVQATSVSRNELQLSSTKTPVTRILFKC